MATKKIDSINEVLKNLCFSVKEVFESNTSSEVAFAPTAQKIPTTNLMPDIGGFVQFSGDFSALVVMNFPAAAAMEIYKHYMLSMGIPEEELKQTHTSDEVPNALGELMNQIIGRFRQKLEKQFGLYGTHNQPKAVGVSKTIVITIATGLNKPRCRRISFTTASGNQFYLELAMEKTEFVPLFPVEVKDEEETIDPDDIMAQLNLEDFQ